MHSTQKQARPRFYGLIQTTHKVKRKHNSTSFRASGVGYYSIVKNGKRIPLKARVFNEDKLNTQMDAFSIALTTRKGEQAGVVCVNKYRGYRNYHRIVVKEYRGYNLGKLLFRLAEQEVKRRGGKSVLLSSNQQSTVATALSLGYTIVRNSGGALKRRLELEKRKPLPKNQELVKLLAREEIFNFPYVDLEMKLK